MSGGFVRVTIPASTANLGPGFDALGMAFQLYSVVEMKISDQTTIELIGKELQGTPTDKSNLLYQVAAELFQEAGQSVPELAIRASSDAPLSLLVAALAQGRLDLLGQAMGDRLHQPYRAELVPGLTDILDKATEHGAVGAALSGAGPTILCFFSSDEDLQRLRGFVDRVMKGHDISYRVMVLQPDDHGVQVEFHQT
jgi:homoserine kinase